MAAVTSPRHAAPTAQPHLVDVLRSEWCKFRSVRSTSWTMVAAVVSNIVIAGLAAVLIAPNLSTQDQATTDSIRLSLAGLHLSQIAVGVLGALIVTSEYGTGLIRTTFAAVPQRRVVLLAKTLVFTAAALVVGVSSCFVAYVVFEASLTGEELSASLGDPGVPRAIVGGGLYLVVLGLLGLGLGVIIRSSAGTIATLFGLMFVPSILIDLLPGSWQETVGPYLPMNAGNQIFIAVDRDPNSLGPWTGFAVFALYGVVAMVIGFVVIGRRDA
jgi:hypothetical protein